MNKIDPSQLTFDDLAKNDPVLSWACSTCGFHAKTEAQRDEHEHQTWTLLKWDSPNKLNESSKKFLFVEPIK